MRPPFISIIAVAMVAALAFCRPDIFYKLKAYDQSLFQTGETGEAVEGSYSWTSPDGDIYFVTYVADANGYRFLDSNAVTIGTTVITADGTQGAFSDDEDIEVTNKY